MKNAITLAHALKEKSRLAAKLAETRALVVKYNAVDLGTRRPININELLMKIPQLEENLIRYKTAIANANCEINRLLIEMMFVRGQMAFYQSLDTEEVQTKTKHTAEGYEDLAVTRDLVITKQAVFAKIEALQEKLNQLQDQVDAFNATKCIEIELL